MCPRPRRRRTRPPPAPTPPPLPYFPSMEERRAALACQKNLQDGISAALNEISRGQSSPMHTISSLQSALHEVDGLGSFFSLYLDSLYYNERRSDDCTAAQRTFDVPELLEMILDAAEIPDILSMYAVNRTIRDSIECSSRMQTKLCLRAAPAHSHLETPLSYCFIKYFDCERTPMACYPPVPIGRGFSCSIGRLPVMPLPPFTGPEDDEKSRTVTLNAYFYPFKQQRLGGLGARIRRMFICQPPVKRMTVHLSCCPNMDIYFSDPPPPAPEYVSSETGLTIGDLYDCAARLMDQHRWCPYAHAGQLDDDGMVDNAVQFQASVVLSPEDPMMLSCREADTSMDADNKRREMRKAKLTVYTNAKRQANSANERIPTMQEFEAAYHEDTDWIALAYPRAVPPVPQSLGYPPPVPPAVPTSSGSAPAGPLTTTPVTAHNPANAQEPTAFSIPDVQEGSSGAAMDLIVQSMDLLTTPSSGVTVGTQ